MADQRNTLTKALKTALDTHHFTEKDEFLVACSGGSDSVSLVMAAKHSGLSFSIAHVDYGLRGQESTKDAEFVRQLGTRLLIPVYVHEVKKADWVSDGNIQDQARQIRYEFFHSLMSHGPYACCLLAHQQDDQSETILMSLIRGNNFRVLSPMPDARPGYLRPFLHISRETCRQALEAWGELWREDSSNLKNQYTRNHLRNEIFPHLQSVNPSISSQLAERASIYQQQRDLLKSLLQENLRKGIRITERVSTFQWAHLPKDLTQKHLRMILASVLDDWGWHGYDLWAGADLCNATPGKSHLHAGELIRGRDMVQWIREGSNPGPSMQISGTDQLPVATSTGRSVTITLEPAPSQRKTGPGEDFIDPDRIHWPLQLREPKQGDKFVPLGMKGSKLASDMMIDSKFRPAQKRLALILEDLKGPVWLSDFRIADRVKMTDESRYIIRLVTEEAD